MSRTLLVVSIVLLVFSSLLSVPKVTAQGGDQVGDETEFILFIHGQPDPDDVFTLSREYCRRGLCRGAALQPRPICGSKERYLEDNSYRGWTIDGYAGPCQDGGIYTIAEKPVEGTTIDRYTISRRFLNEAGESKEDILSSGSPVVNGGIYFTTYRYPSEAPTEPPMPEAPPEVGGGGMSEHRTPPVRLAVGGSSLAYRS